MKAITIMQPYAGLILSGLKRVETRSWNTNVRGRVAIHAGISDKGLKEWLYGALDPSYMRTGCILGTVEIIDCVPLNRMPGGGYTRYITGREARLGDWSDGRYGFILNTPIPFPEPIPAKGKQGWWNWEPCEARDDP